MRSGAVCLPSKRFVSRGCQTRPALACHKYAGSLRINTTIFRSRAASPLAALLPYYNQAPSYGRGLVDKFILKTGSSLFPKICRSYFLFTPHGLGDFLDQFELVPLFQLGQLVADLTGGKAALRTQAKTVERDMLFCLMDAGDYSIFVLQTGRFGRYKTQHHLFAICNILQRLKAAGARIVKFQIKRIHIFLCQQEGGNGEVIALARPSGMVVAAADMGCDGQAFRAVFQCQIIQAQILGSDILDLVWVSFRKFW